MSMAASIRRYVFACEPTKIFTSREFQQFGTRTAVDQELYRLTKRGKLIRLANGVFVRADHPEPFMPPETIVKAKADAFGKNVVADGSEILSQLEITETPRNNLTFATSGHTSEFRLHLHGMRIQLRGVSPRKLLLGDGAPGALIRAFWHLGKEEVNVDLLRDAIQMLNRQEKEAISKLIFLMPFWQKNAFLELQSINRSARQLQKEQAQTVRSFQEMVYAYQFPWRVNQGNREEQLILQLMNSANQSSPPSQEVSTESHRLFVSFSSSRPTETLRDLLTTSSEAPMEKITITSLE